MKNLKDLKSFKGNLRGADYGFFPKDKRKYKTSDIHRLQPEEVNVKALLPNPNGSKQLRPTICTVAELPDQNQTEWILGQVRQLREKQILTDAAAVSADGVHTLDTLIKKYLLDYASKKKSIWDIQKRLEYWQRTLGHLTLEELTPAIISTQKRDLGKTRSGATVNRFLGVLSSCLSYGVKELHWTDDNPLRKVQKEAEDSGRIRWLSDEERERLFKGLEECESPVLKDLVIFCLAVGCRRGEALGLRWQDIDFEKLQIHFRNVKRRTVCADASTDKDGNVVIKFDKNVIDAGLKNSSKIKIISIDDDAFGPLKQLLLKRKIASRSDKVFPEDPRHAWQNLVKRIGLEDFRFHDLRHTCASYALQAGKTLIEVATLLGHESLVSAKRYAHHAPEANKHTGAAVASRLFG